MSNSEKEFYTTGDIARAIGVSNPTIRSYINKGLIKPDMIMPSGRLKFSYETVKEFMSSLQTKQN